MRGLILQLNCYFSDDEKEACLPVIEKIIELAGLARMKGILALEMEAQQETYSLFLRTALQLVVDGTDPITVEQILQNLILADRFSGSQLLERLLVAEGVLALQQGENPFTIEIKLRSMLGEKFILSKEDRIATSSKRMEKYCNFHRSLENRLSIPESQPFETRLGQLDNRSLQHVLRNVELGVLEQALIGCTVGTVYKLLDNISMDVCLEIFEAWRNFYPEDLNPCNVRAVVVAQESILKTIDSLESRGEIVTARMCLKK